MSLRKIGFFILSFVLVFSSCKKDDSVAGTVTIEIRDREEQQLADNDSLIDYLGTYYYNAGELAEIGLDAGIQDIIISEIKVDDEYQLLMDNVVKESVTYEDTVYDYYVLELNLGGGIESPTFADTVQILYEGTLLDNSVFDFKFFPDDNPLDLAGVITGWRRVIPNFNVAESFVINDDGLVDYFNSGLGIMFLPSGLAYFSGAPTGIPSYSPLVFKFELLRTGENDHDGDGIPSYLEDLNGDGEFLLNSDVDTMDGDDTDNDGTPNYFDADDDADGVLTSNEDLEDTDLSVDSDGDGDFTNDKNGDGDPTNDDTDGDGIPNYLDPDDKISKL